MSEFMGQRGACHAGMVSRGERMLLAETYVGSFTAFADGAPASAFGLFADTAVSCLELPVPVILGDGRNPPPMQRRRSR